VVGKKYALKAPRKQMFIASKVLYWRVLYRKEDALTVRINKSAKLNNNIVLGAT